MESQRSQFVEKILAFENTQLVKSLEEIGQRLRQDEVSVMNECSTGALFNSGIFATKMIGVYRRHTKDSIDTAIDLRRQSLLKAPELDQPERWQSLTDWCISMIDRMPDRVSVRLQSRGFPVEQFFNNGIAADDVVELRAHARREVHLLKQEHELKAMTENVPTPPQDHADRRKVFVVHGRNEKARRAMFSFLGSIGLEPLEWSVMVLSTGSGSPYNGEILDRGLESATAVVVLITGDDLARVGTRYPRTGDGPQEKNLTPQARPNVLFEAGMAMAKLPKATVFVEFGETRPFTDIGGRNTVRMNNAVAARQALATRLRAAGCDVNLDGTRWHDEGDFNGAIEDPDINSIAILESSPVAPERTIELRSISAHTGSVALENSYSEKEFRRAILGDHFPGRAALVQFRADAYENPVIGRIEFYRADGTLFKTSSGRALTVDKGHWIGNDGSTVTFSPGDSFDLLISLQPSYRDQKLCVIEYSGNTFRQLPQPAGASRVKVTVFNSHQPGLSRGEFWYTLGFDNNGVIVVEEAGIDWNPPTIESASRIVTPA